MSEEPRDPEGTQPPPGTPARPDAPEASARRLVRSRTDEMVGGVAGGIAAYFDIDPTLVRLAWVIAALASGGLAIVAYIVAWIVIPEESDAEAKPHRGGGDGAVMWGALLIGAGVVFLVSRLDLDVPIATWRAAASVVLILTGIALMFEARRGLNGGLVMMALVFTVGLAVATGARFELQSGFGERQVTVTEGQTIDPSYSHAFGALRIEIDDSAIPPGTTPVDVSIAFGEATLSVPEGVGVRVNARSAFGGSQIFGEQAGGLASSRVETTPGYDEAERRLNVTVNSAFGNVRVQQ
ncbi:MAG: PspC domain-containing protein [Dehalococcoidia bacterium]